MRGRRESETPQRFARVVTRFAAWRRTHAPHTRIPKSLWTAAAKLAAEFGMSHTATRLGLNYYDLKKHAQSVAALSPPPSRASREIAFVELPPAASPIPPECFIELENGTGSKMRIYLKGSPMSDLVGLSQCLWNPRQ